MQSLIATWRRQSPPAVRRYLWADTLVPETVVRAEPFGARLWLTLVLVMAAALLLQSYGIGTWPMADDEVPSQVELGRLHIGAERFFSVPPDQIPKLPMATIVWNTFQRAALRLLPDQEVSYRIPGLVCGVLTAGLAFLLAARWRGYWFALALSVLLNGAQIFVYLMPLNRFYGLPLLLMMSHSLQRFLPPSQHRRSAVVRRRLPNLTRRPLPSPCRLC